MAGALDAQADHFEEDDDDFDLFAEKPRTSRTTMAGVPGMLSAADIALTQSHGAPPQQQHPLSNNQPMNPLMAAGPLGGNTNRPPSPLNESSTALDQSVATMTF